MALWPGGIRWLADILATGVLASTERRAVMGVVTELGMSEESDKYSGGASSVPRTMPRARQR